MRALAVLLVIVDHAGFRSAAGGFVGVDVFFVISGFLITGLIVREVARTGRLSLVRFYARRARRILPAAVLVLLATCAAAVVVLPPVRAVEVLRDSIWAAGFGANVRFALVGTDYFAQGQPVSPLQHYWSLSVEEQYYVVWPLLIIAVLALLRLGVRGSVRRMLTLALVVAIAASLIWSVYSTLTSPTTAYFSTFTRAWELGIGSLAAVVLQGQRYRLPRWLAEALPAVGLLAVLGSAVLFDAGTAVPGWIIAIPVVGTALVLGAGSCESTEPSAVARLLSLRPARVVGNWSYSMYLWHFPVLKLAEAHFGERRLTHPQVLVALVLIVALSALSYRFVEEPFRRGKLLQGASWRSIVLYPLGVVLVVAGAGIGRDYVDHQIGAGGDNAAIRTSDFAGRDLSKDPRVALVQASVLAAEEGRAVPSDLTPELLGLRKDVAPLGDCDYRTGTRELCPTGDPDADRSIVVLGDSFARAWGPALTTIGERHGYAVYHLVYSGCSPNAAVVIQGKTQRVWQECADFKEWARSVIAKLHPDLVVLASGALGPVVAADGSHVGFRDDRDQFVSTLLDGFAQELKDLTPNADQVAFIGNTPTLPRESGVCLSRRNADLGDCLFASSDISDQIQAGFLRETDRAGAATVDTRRWFCAGGQCPSVVGRTIAMRDKEHVTPEYARELAEPIARALGLDSASS